MIIYHQFITHIPNICWGLWTFLGFIRGIQHYQYKHTTSMGQSNSILYINSLYLGCWGGILYACPVLLPFSIYKELYKLEVNIRNLEDEKKTSYYNDLI